jgi:sigma-E factor negative regulatory protein RseC
MPTETGRVVAIEADALWVETIRRSTCGGCAAQKGCGHALLDRGSDRHRGRIRILPGARSVCEFTIDDQVQFDIADATILRGSLIAYGLPLFGLLAGALATAWWLPGNRDVVAVLGATVGLLLGFALVRWHGDRHRGDPDFQPVLQDLATPLEQPLALR